MKVSLIALLSGILFGIGLAFSGMINPNKVLNFLDVTGNWDPSLIFVMLGALTVSAISFRLILKQEHPLLMPVFHLSKNTLIDKSLLIGAGCFGIGWGMTGYCPGPAVASLGLFSIDGAIMVLSIYAGFFTQHWFSRK